MQLGFEQNTEELFMLLRCLGIFEHDADGIS